MGRLKILVCAYRKWAKKIIVGLDHDFYIVANPKMLKSAFKHHKPDIVLLLGWSWKVPKEIYKAVPTICLHPSPLPKYRGGSPLQHQIMGGEKEGAITYFMVDDGIDTGPILAQASIPLMGNLKDIFQTITIMGRVLLRGILSQYPNFKTTPQANGGSYYERRNPSLSEIPIYDLIDKGAEEIYNFIRALEDPYPNAFIVCGDGKKLYIKEASLGT